MGSIYYNSLRYPTLDPALHALPPLDCMPTQLTAVPRDRTPCPGENPFGLGRHSWDRQDVDGHPGQARVGLLLLFAEPPSKRRTIKSYGWLGSEKFILVQLTHRWAYNI
jgi:hypothetical protein